MDEPVGVPPPNRRETPPAAPPEYAPPQVVTYRGQQILEELAPAQACSFVHSILLCG